MSSSGFEFFVAGLIFANSFAIGAEVEYMARTGTVSTPRAFLVLDACFTALFLAELLLRLWVERCHFFKSSDRMWNTFDVVIVLSSIIDTGMSIAFLLYGATDSDARSGGSRGSNVRAVRVLRLARLGRTLRIQRVFRFVYALRTLVYSIFATLRSLVWALILLLLLMYIFGVIFVQSTIAYIVEEGKFNPALQTFWGTLPDAMFTLFKSICGGLSWHDAVTPLADISVVLVSLFGVFIFFTYFAVLNVVTGIFCHSAIESAERDPDLVVQALVSSKKVHMDKIRKLFKNMDMDESGLITLRELEDIMRDDHVKAYFGALQIDISDAWALFKLLDVDNSGTIDIDEFVWGCMRLKGPAKAADLATLMHDSRWIARRLSRFIRYAETQFQKMDRALSSTCPLLPQAADLSQCNNCVKEGPLAPANEVGCPRPLGSLTEEGCGE